MRPAFRPGLEGALIARSLVYVWSELLLIMPGEQSWATVRAIVGDNNFHIEYE